mgnify:CR=1 FL=1
MKEYSFVNAIKEVIEECKQTGRGKNIKTDSKSNITLWLESEWTEYDESHDVIELFICYVDTGRIAYSTYIMETLAEK